MATMNGALNVCATKRKLPLAEPLSYQTFVSRLLLEMVRLVRPTESDKFSPPFRLVIIDNHGDIAFNGEVGSNGKIRQAGPARKVRRSHFPANALITDRSHATRTFRIDWSWR